MRRSPFESPVGLWVIGTYKLIKASLLIAAGIAILRFRHVGVAEWLRHLATRLRMDPDDRLLHAALARLSGLDARQLEMIGAGTCLYGLLYVAQSVGLLLQRRWGESLVVVTTGFLIPFEAYEVIRKLTPIRVTVLVLNVAIVAYLVARLRRESGRQGQAFGAAPAPSHRWRGSGHRLSR